MMDTTCNNCKGLDNCSKACIYHSGKALVNFITGVDMIETRIGEFSSRTIGGVQDLVVSGHQLWELDHPSWLMTDINTILDVSDKFRTAFDKNAFQIASEYCKFIKMTNEEIRDITEKIKCINKNKMLVLPFKPHTRCNIDYELDGKQLKNKESEIHSIKWRTDKETHKLDCDVNFLDGETNKIIKINIKEYLRKFRLNKMDNHSKVAKTDIKMIEFTDYGIIKPIVVDDGKNKLALDGTYLYYKELDDLHIVGYWDNRDNLVFSDNIKCKAITKIKDNMNLIRNHKRYIAPYLLYEENTIKVK